MGGWGRQNPWPFQWGGGETIFEQLWNSMRDMLGTKGAGPRGSIEDAWREAKVGSICRVMTMMERAALQSLPSKATDMLPVYEDMLKVPRAATDEARRLAVTTAWTQSLTAVLPELQGRLTAIDSGLVITTVNHDESAVFQFGAAFETEAANAFTPAASSTPAESQYPMFSDHFVLHVQWSGQPSGIPDPVLLDLVTRELNQSLPAWVTFNITTNSGFILDTSNLDYTAL